MNTFARLSAVSLLAVTVAAAQPAVNLPRQSPAATVSQTFAYTTATVSYSRPAVNGRLIWGGLVPWDRVWRAGANEATSVEFTTNVRVNGNPLPKGKYALYVLPAPHAWTFIFDTNPNAWGSFAYDGKHDALRVTVVPRQAPHQERLEFGFENLTDSSAVLTLHWEQLKAGLTISADFLETALASIASGLPQARADDPYAWLGAARFYRAHGLDRAQAYAWVDRSIAVRPMHANLWTKAEWLAQDGRYAEAVTVGRQAREDAAKDPNLASQLLSIDATLAGWEQRAR